MNKETINFYIMINAKYFEPTAIPVIRKKLEKIDEKTFLTLQTCNLKDPSMIFLFSCFLGYLGMDRFLIGDIGMGLLKLFTLGGFGILTIIDLFNIIKRTKQKNFEAINVLL